LELNQKEVKKDLERWSAKLQEVHQLMEEINKDWQDIYEGLNEVKQ